MISDISWLNFLNNFVHIIHEILKQNQVFIFQKESVHFGLVVVEQQVSDLLFLGWDNTHSLKNIEIDKWVVCDTVGIEIIDFILEQNTLVIWAWVWNDRCQLVRNTHRTDLKLSKDILWLVYLKFDDTICVGENWVFAFLILHQKVDIFCYYPFSWAITLADFVKFLLVVCFECSEQFLHVNVISFLDGVFSNNTIQEKIGEENSIINRYRKARLVVFHHCWMIILKLTCFLQFIFQSCFCITDLSQEILRFRIFTELNWNLQILKKHFVSLIILQLWRKNIQ